MKRTPLNRKTPMRRSRAKTRRVVTDPGPRPDPDGRFWHAQRKTIHDRAAGRCERCGIPFTGHWEAHHRKLRSQGGPDDIVNLTALCTELYGNGCHTGSTGVHSHSIVARSQGFIVPATQDPAAWAMQLWDGRTVRLLEDGCYDVVFDAPVVSTG